MATKNSTALKVVPTSSKTNAAKTPESIREAIIQEVLDAMSLGDCSDPAPTSVSGYGYDDEDFLINNHFAYSASQLNADLALTAQCELEGDFDFNETDDDALEFYNSSEFDKARRTFVDDLKERILANREKRPTNVADPLVNFARRMRYSGLLSPERKEPDSDYVRAQRRKQRRQWREEHKQRMAAK
jgi:hypothetical protein